MTKKELIDSIKDLPDESEIDIYDINRFYHPNFKVNLQTYYDYTNGLPIITFEVNYD